MDEGVYWPEPNETVRLAREPGAKFQFVRFGNDKGGDFAVVIGGPPGHRIERCVTVDRIVPLRRRAKPIAVRS